MNERHFRILSPSGTEKLILSYLHPGERYLHIGINVLEIGFPAQAAHVGQTVGAIDDEDVSSAWPEGQSLAADRKQ